MEKIVERIKRILLNPLEALRDVKTEDMDTSVIIKDYLVILAAIPAGAWFIGLIGRAPFGKMLVFSGLLYALMIISVFISAKIIEALAANFNSIKSDMNVFKLAFYILVPSFVAGIFNINPSLRYLWYLGSLYGVYILYLGLPVLMETPDDKRIAYTAVSAGVIYVVMTILFTIIASSLPSFDFD